MAYFTGCFHFSYHWSLSLTSRRSQPRLALSVPLSRFTSRVGGGSAFFVRRICRRFIMHPLFTVSPMFAVSEDFTPKGIGSSIFCRFEAVQVAGGTRFHRRVVVTLGFVPQAGFRFSIPVSTLVVAVFAFVGCYHIFVSVDHPPNKLPEPKPPRWSLCFSGVFIGGLAQ